MEARESVVPTVKNKKLTPKAAIHQKFGKNACYRTEEVLNTDENGCPGLAIAQKGPVFFRCTLQLPELCVSSDLYKRKKDAEQCAAQKALDKLGILLEEPSADNVHDPWDNVVFRITYLFSDEILSTLHPLSSHFRASLQGGRDLNGAIPISVLPMCDTKLNNICKSIDSEVELNPLLAILIIIKASAKLPGAVALSEDNFLLRRQKTFPSEIIPSFHDEQAGMHESISVGTIYIPDTLEKPVQPLSACFSTNEYYLDCIARNLGVSDASKVMLSRIIGKTSSEMRLYYSLPTANQYDSSLNLLEAVKSMCSGASLNLRASYISGQHIYGNAILASIGYVWNLQVLHRESISVRTYYRILLGKVPTGVYKLSRDSIFASDLPDMFTTRTNWRGLFPKEILSRFCSQHRLSEPVFVIHTIPVGLDVDSPDPCKRLKIEDSEITNHNIHDNHGDSGGKVPAIECNFRCELKISSKCHNLLITYSQEESYKKQSDAIQHAALKVVLWLNVFFKEADMSLEDLRSSGSISGIQLFVTSFLKEFSLFLLLKDEGVASKGLSLRSHLNWICSLRGDIVDSLEIDGPECGAIPFSGSVVTTSYSVSLVLVGENTTRVIETNDDFEFEIGSGMILQFLEAVVLQLSMGQSARFCKSLNALDLIYAAAGILEDYNCVLTTPESCCLEYTISLLKVSEPLEDRMEQALFSPPLSKQRVEYAVRHIKEYSAGSLIDFGCGSGSLLVSLLDCSTGLEKIVGVDISQRGLVRAAKVLHSKLSTDSETNRACASLRSILLFEGSIIEADSRLRGCDIGTCLEVIEHMEEDQARMFGELVLGYFVPRIAIISTPNYEYNSVLRRSTQEGEIDEKMQSNAFKFRNQDHKFEWTRAQFNCWASELASKHNYVVEFSGVGGSSDVEPGFASQIAVFRRSVEFDYVMNNAESVHRYGLIWEWNAQPRHAAVRG